MNGSFNSVVITMCDGKSRDKCGANFAYGLAAARRGNVAGMPRMQLVEMPQISRAHLRRQRNIGAKRSCIILGGDERE